MTKSEHHTCEWASYCPMCEVERLQKIADDNYAKYQEQTDRIGILITDVRNLRLALHGCHTMATSITIDCELVPDLIPDDERLGAGDDPVQVGQKP